MQGTSEVQVTGSPRARSGTVSLGALEVAPLSDAAGGLEKRLSALDGAELNHGVAGAAMSVALHRMFVDQDSDLVEAGRVGRIADDDELVASVLEVLLAALNRGATPPLPPITAALARAMHSPELMPRSRSVVVSLTDRLERAAGPATHLEELRSFAGALEARAERGPWEALETDISAWSFSSRWDLIDLLTGDAARSSDVALVERLGDLIVEELVRSTSPRFSGLRRWLAVCSALRDRGGGEDRLGDAKLRVLDALELREDEPLIEKFLEELRFDPVATERRALIRELWAIALDPSTASRTGVLRRIRGRFGELTEYEESIARLAEELGHSTGVEGLRSAVGFLRKELAVRAAMSPARIPWMVRIRPSGATEAGPGWKIDSVFAAVVMRAVIKGDATLKQNDGAGTPPLVDGLLDEVRTFVEGHDGDATLLDESAPMWESERLVLEVERLIARGEPEPAIEAWSSFSIGLRRRTLGRALRDEAAKFRGSTTHQHGRARQFVAALVLDRLDDTSEEGVDAVAEVIAESTETDAGLDISLPGFRWYDGTRGAEAVTALMGAVDQVYRVVEWRDALRVAAKRFIEVLGSQEFLREEVSPGDFVLTDEVVALLIRASSSVDNLRALLGVGLALARSGPEGFHKVRRDGWLADVSETSPKVLARQLVHLEDLDEFLSLYDEVEQMRSQLVGNEPDAAAHPEVGTDGDHETQDAVDGVPAGGSPSYARKGLFSLGSVLRKHAKEQSRFRADNIFSWELRAATYAARMILESHLRARDVDAAASFVSDGIGLVAEIGHPFSYMPVVQALIDANRPERAAELLRQIDHRGGSVDLLAITAVIGGFMNSMTVCIAMDPGSQIARDQLESIEQLVERHRPKKMDSKLYGRLIRANALVGRIERCEEIAESCQREGIWDLQLDLDLIRVRAREGTIESVDAAVESAMSRAGGRHDVREILRVVALGLGSAGRISEGMTWIRATPHTACSEQELFQALVQGVSLSGWHHAYVGKAIGLEDFRALQERMYGGELPLDWSSIRDVLDVASRLAIRGSDGDRLVIAQESARLMTAARERIDDLPTEELVEQLCWVAKWTRSGRLAAQAADLIYDTGFPWTHGRAGRLIEALAYSHGIVLARRLLRSGLEVCESDEDAVYLYNVFLSVLRGREHDDERNAILREMQDRGLELDRFSRAELSAALAVGRAFEDDTRMLRGSAASTWQELVGPLREGAELFEPIVARLHLELRTLKRAIDSGRSLQVLGERAEDVAEIQREFAVKTKEFQESVSRDDAGNYSETRYAITSDIVHELSQPSITLALQVRGLMRAIELEDLATVQGAIEELLGTSRVLGLKIKSYRDSLAEAHADTVGQEDVSIHKAFLRAVEMTDPELKEGVRIIGADALRSDQKFDRDLIVRGSNYLLQRAFHAMLTNSLEAMRAANVERPTIQVEGLYHPNAILDGARYGTVQFFISDNGPGIPEEICEEIFKVGFTTRRQRGLGLGLATVASIVDLHGGVVQVVDPRHARFIIVLPAADVGRGQLAAVEAEQGSDEPPVGSVTAAEADVVPNGPIAADGDDLDRHEAGSSRTAGVVVRVKGGESTVEEEGTDRPYLARGWILVEGIDGPVQFRTRDPDVVVGATVNFRLQQTRFGPRADELELVEPPPREPRVTGIIERVPDEVKQVGFILVRERGKHLAFFLEAGTDEPDLAVGDLVSAVVVPSYNRTRSVVSEQATDIRRI